MAPAPTTKANSATPSTLSPAHLSHRTFSRHPWTEKELNYLCCLRLFTNLSHSEISVKMQEVLGVQLSKEILRYRENVLKGHAPPSQGKRRKVELVKDARWKHFENLKVESLTVQRILRACRYNYMWKEQMQDDHLVVLCMYGQINDDAEVANILNRRFPHETWTADQVTRRYSEMEETKAGSYVWFKRLEENQDDDIIQNLLNDCGLI